MAWAQGSVLATVSGSGTVAIAEYADYYWYLTVIPATAGHELGTYPRYYRLGWLALGPTGYSPTELVYIGFASGHIHPSTAHHGQLWYNLAAGVTMAIRPINWS